MIESIHFVEGLRDGERAIAKTNERNGTKVSWQASEEFFEHPVVDINAIKNLFKTISCLCPGLLIHLDYNGDIIDYQSTNGIIDLLDEKTREKEIIKKRFADNIEIGKNKLNVVLTYTSNYVPSITAYVNVGLTESGPHITQMKTLITRELNKFFREKKWLKDKDENLSGDDCQEGLNLIFNITAANVAYDSQVKTRIARIDIKDLLNQFAIDFQKWLVNNEKDVKQIADKAINARKARDAARKAREAIRNKGEKKTKALKFDSKLADCFSPDRKKCEIYIVEGNSAAGNLKSARNNEFTAVLPIRGKLLNTRQSTFDKIQKNAEIITMIDAFGLKLDPKTMKLVYNENDLRYDKIIIESDADFDGAHIKNLFYTFIWTFAPQLIIEGHIYAGVPPLYKITEGKDTYIYLKDDTALAEYKAKTKSSKYSVKHLKG